MDQIDRSGPIWIEWTELTKMDRIELEWTKVDRNGHKKTKWTEILRYCGLKKSSNNKCYD